MLAGLVLVLLVGCPALAPVAATSAAAYRRVNNLTLAEFALC